MNLILRGITTNTGGIMRSKSAEAIVEELLTINILNGVYQAGERLKPERELALEFGYSRPVIHKAIIRLEGRGLVTIIPRQGVMVNDYRTFGKLSLLESIYDLNHARIQIELNRSMIQFIEHTLFTMIDLVQCRQPESRKECHDLQSQNSYERPEDIFLWMQTYALQCGNPIYPMIVNEFRSGILNVADAVLNNESTSHFKELIQKINALVIAENVFVYKQAEPKAMIHTLFQYIEKYWLV